jgi:predicted nucleic acid-binding protein
MLNSIEYIYWDSCVVTAFMNEEDVRAPIIDAILAKISKSKGSTKLVTSTLSKVEMAFVVTEKATEQLSADAEKKIDNFWADSSVIELVEFHDVIAMKARSLIRAGIINGWHLKPADAIHLATAQWIGVSELQTYNLKHFERYEALLGFKVREPAIEQPPLFKLPDEKP